MRAQPDAIADSRSYIVADMWPYFIAHSEPNPRFYSLSYAICKSLSYTKV